MRSVKLALALTMLVGCYDSTMIEEDRAGYEVVDDTDELVFEEGLFFTPRTGEDPVEIDIVSITYTQDGVTIFGTIEEQSTEFDLDFGPNGGRGRIYYHYPNRRSSFTSDLWVSPSAHVVTASEEDWLVVGGWQNLERGVRIVGEDVWWSRTARIEGALPIQE